MEQYAIEIFQADEVGYYSASSIFSEYLLINVFEPRDVSDIVKEMVVQAEDKKDKRPYHAVVSLLMKFSSLKSIFGSSSSWPSIVGDLYEKMRRDIGINKEPLFWLQYSIFMYTQGKMQEAEDFVDTAYDRANSLHNFKTYQIDTHALRLYMEIEAESSGNLRVDRFQYINDLLDKTIIMLGDESHRYYIYKVLEEMPTFVKNAVLKMDSSEKSAMYYQVNRILDALQVAGRKGDDNYDVSGLISGLAALLRVLN